MKFSGNNSDNNCVWIDYDSKTVRFKPVKSVGDFERWFLLFFVLCIVNYLHLIIPLSIFGLIFLYLHLDFAVILFLFLFLYLILNFVISLHYCIKDWRFNFYPEFNYRLLKRFGGEDKFVMVNPSAVVNRKFFLPYFGNIMLRYRADGDFAKYLKSVAVENVFVGDDSQWFAVFTFKKQPKFGNFGIMYM